MKVRYLILIALFTVYYSCFLFQELWISKDSAVYILLARSLAEGKGYFDYYPPQAKAHAVYPPGYPFIIYAIIRTFGDRLLFFRLASIFFAGLSLVVLIRLLGRYLDEREVLVILLLFALNPLFLGFTHSVVSEPAYLLFSWLGICLFPDTENVSSVRKIFLAALFTIAGFYTRTVGISLFLAVVIYLSIRKNWRQAAFVSLLGFIMLPWLRHVLRGSAGYGQIFSMENVYDHSLGNIWLTDLPFRFLSNVKYYAAKVISDTLFYPYFKEITFGNYLLPVKAGLSLCFTLFFVSGFYFILRRGIRIRELYILLYFCILFLWPYHDERFLLPVYPFLLGYLLFSLRNPKLKFLRVAVVLALLFALVPANLNAVKNLIKKKEPQQKAALQEAISWLQTNAPQDTIIMSFDPAGIYFYTQRKGVVWNLNSRPDALLAEIKENRVGYLLAEKEAGLTVKGKKILNSNSNLRPLLEKYPAYFKLVFRSSAKPEFLVYETNAYLWNTKN